MFSSCFSQALVPAEQLVNPSDGGGPVQEQRDVQPEVREALQQVPVSLQEQPPAPSASATAAQPRPELRQQARLQQQPQHEQNVLQAPPHAQPQHRELGNEQGVSTIACLDVHELCQSRPAENQAAKNELLERVRTHGVSSYKKVILRSTRFFVQLSADDFSTKSGVPESG